MSHKTIATFILLCLVFIFSLPSILKAQVGNSPPTAPTTPNVKVEKAPDTGITYECVQKGAGPIVNGVKSDIYGNCGFYDLVSAVIAVVNWGTTFALAFSVVVIAYAGFIYMKSGGSSSERDKANGMLWRVVIGIAVILAAWFIVKIISDVLLTGQVKSIIPLNQ